MTQVSFDAALSTKQWSARLSPVAQELIDRRRRKRQNKGLEILEEMWRETAVK